MELGRAICKSGYPLQGEIAQQLRERFGGFGRVQDEWSYVDSDTNQQRSIDILAEKHLYRSIKVPVGGSQVRPELDLLVECKQSDSPYVFFLLPKPRRSNDFPVFSGLFKNEIKIDWRTDRGVSKIVIGITEALGLDKHRFLRDVPCASTFSKCVRKGKNFELSGSDRYHALVLPLTKAMKHFQIAERPPATASHFDIHLGLGVAVLEAPMVGVAPASDSSLILMPWVRIFRHEYQDTEKWYERNRLYAVDLVHKDFFEKYLDEHAIPFAEQFGRRVSRHREVLASGKGFVSGQGIKDIESRLRARPEKTVK